MAEPLKGKWKEFKVKLPSKDIIEPNKIINMKRAKKDIKLAVEWLKEQLFIKATILISDENKINLSSDDLKKIYNKLDEAFEDVM